ncbi:exodeoxyribonuclease III [Frischella sp. Ac13]|uniref:Exodeoxyribonuclease III n=1 Tax=Frischella japonica TaxID=2741544 RepID=A0ABR7QU68_9GAMM|nr:exodeoxyribonuclease III [Frischella japonica]MBC9129763.1 exodeoxyribonuclease III [Frischella japonica]
MKFISFNINSLRARIHQLEAIINKYQPDVIGLQETKVHNELFPIAELEHLGYHMYYHGQKSHYGVALLTKQVANTVRYGLPTDTDDAQCRLIEIKIPSKLGEITIINGYFPQGDNREHPIKFPTKQKFYQDLFDYLQTAALNQQLTIIMGDMNISPTDLDIGLSEESKKRWLKTGKCSFLPEERQWMAQIFQLGFVDTFRSQNPLNKQYSWFDYRSRGFDTNTGLRIDLILASQQLTQYCINTGIDLEIRGMDKPSDHAPIWAEFDC